MIGDDVSASLDRARDAALQFLLRNQTSDGAWKDFVLPAGASDQWVTGYVGSALAEVDDPQARGAARLACELLLGTERPDGGWSYNAHVPSDADSTLWGLRLATQLGLGDHPRLDQAARFLREHLCTDGGLTTYARPSAIRRYVGLPDTFSFAGWTQPHICVSAAGAHLPELRAALCDYLVAHQAPSGQWRSYWWFSDEYATSEAASALAARLLGVRAVRVLHFAGFFKPAGGPATPWHQDAGFIPLDTDDLLSLWIPLTDVAPDMGGLLFASGSHRHGPRAPSAQAGFPQVANGPLAAGDLSIHAGWTLHASTANDTGAMREAIAISYYADGARIDTAGRFPFARSLIEGHFPGLKRGDVAVGEATPIVYSHAKEQP